MQASCSLYCSLKNHVAAHVLFWLRSALLVTCQSAQLWNNLPTFALLYLTLQHPPVGLLQTATLGYQVGWYTRKWMQKLKSQHLQNTFMYPTTEVVHILIIMHVYLVINSTVLFLFCQYLTFSILYKYFFKSFVHLNVHVMVIWNVSKVSSEPLQFPNHNSYSNWAWLQLLIGAERNAQKKRPPQTL